MDQFEIRSAEHRDKESIWEIIHAVISKGDTYVFEPSTPKEQMLVYWFAPGTFTYVAVLNNIIVGTYVFKPNRPGLGAHVANASYIVHPQYRVREWEEKWQSIL